MSCELIDPPLENSFDVVFNAISRQLLKVTPMLMSMGGVPFEAEAIIAKTGERLILLPKNHKIYENDWGYASKTVKKKVKQNIARFSVPLDRWASTV